MQLQHLARIYIYHKHIDSDNTNATQYLTMAKDAVELQGEQRWFTIPITTILPTRRPPVMDPALPTVSPPSTSQDVIRSKSKKECKSIECQSLSKSIKCVMDHIKMGQTMMKSNQKIGRQNRVEKD